MERKENRKISIQIIFNLDPQKIITISVPFQEICYNYCNFCLGTQAQFPTPLCVLITSYALPQ